MLTPPKKTLHLVTRRGLHLWQHIMGETAIGFYVSSCITIAHGCVKFNRFVIFRFKHKGEFSCSSDYGRKWQASSFWATKSQSRIYCIALFEFIMSESTPGPKAWEIVPDFKCGAALSGQNNETLDVPHASDGGDRPGELFFSQEVVKHCARWIEA